MDGTSLQAGSVFAREKVHFAVNIRRYGKKQLCSSAPVGRKSVLIHQPGGSLVLRPQGRAEVFSRRTPTMDSSFQGNVAEGKGKKYSTNLPVFFISGLIFIS